MVEIPYISCVLNSSDGEPISSEMNDVNSPRKRKKKHRRVIEDEDDEEEMPDAYVIAAEQEKIPDKVPISELVESSEYEITKSEMKTESEAVPSTSEENVKEEMKENDAEMTDQSKLPSFDDSTSVQELPPLPVTVSDVLLVVCCSLCVCDCVNAPDAY